MAEAADTGQHQREAVALEREVARLYELYADRIFGYCLYRLGNRTEAEDAVQTTFLYVFRGLQRGVVPEVESSWLFTIAHNVCRSARRSVRRRRRVESQQDPQLLQELAPGIERDNDSLLGLEDALASIPENQRRAILLREWQGMPYREIAATLGLTQTAVEMLVFRARRSLADALTDGRRPDVRRRVARALNLGNIAAGAKTLFGGFSAAHAAAAAATVVTIATAAGDSLAARGAQSRMHAPVAVAQTALPLAALPPAVGGTIASTRAERRKGPAATRGGAPATVTVSSADVANATPAAPPPPPSQPTAKPADATVPPVTVPTPALPVETPQVASVPQTPAVPAVDVPAVDVQATVDAVKSAAPSAPKLP